MITPPDVRIARLDTAQQAAVRALVLAGLAERWGGLDPTLNGDLDDIETTHGADNVVVASVGDEVVGCGMLVAVGADGDGVGEVVRMAVAPAWRRRGVALAVLHELRRRAIARGLTRLVVETNDDWTEARALYERFGFRFTHYEVAEFGRGAWYSLVLG